MVGLLWQGPPNRLVEPRAKFAHQLIRDPDDDYVLACAIAEKADLVVSGDSDLLELGQYQGIPMLSPVEALRRLAQR